MVTMQLSSEDARFLCQQLSAQAKHIEHELVRTDTPTMQHDLAGDLERLQALRDELAATLGHELEPEGQECGPIASAQRPPDDS